MDACLSCLGLGRARRGSTASGSRASLLHGDANPYGGYGALSGDPQPFARDPNLYYNQASRQPDPEQLQREMKELEKICNIAAETLVDVSQGRSSLQMHTLPPPPFLDGASNGTINGAEAPTLSYGSTSFAAGTAGSAVSPHSHRSAGSIVRLPRSYARLFAEAFPAPKESPFHEIHNAVDGEPKIMNTSEDVHEDEENGTAATQIDGQDDSVEIEHHDSQRPELSNKRESEAQWMKRAALQGDNASAGDWNKVNNYTGGLTFTLEDSNAWNQQDGLG